MVVLWIRGSMRASLLGLAGFRRGRADIRMPLLRLCGAQESIIHLANADMNGWLL